MYLILAESKNSWKISKPLFNNAREVSVIPYSNFQVYSHTTLRETVIQHFKNEFDEEFDIISAKFKMEIKNHRKLSNQES